MEQLYPQNIVERTFPILRERREREEREAAFDVKPPDDPAFESVEGAEEGLYENEPVDTGPVGQRLNTLA